jgi:hypothetical protein
MDFLVVNKAGVKSPYVLFFHKGFQDNRPKMLSEIGATEEVEQKTLELLAFVIEEDIHKTKEAILYQFTRPELKPEERLLGLWSYSMKEVFRASPNKVEELKEKVRILESLGY